MIWSIVCTETAFVEIANLALVRPTGTITVTGTVAEEELETSFTVSDPLVGPGIAFKDSTAVADVPPGTDVGEMTKELIWNGTRVTLAVWLTPP